MKLEDNRSFYVILESNLLLDKRISDKEIRIYALISNYANNKNGYCYLSYSQLYKILNISKRQFIRCLNNLVKLNYIAKIKKTNRIYLAPIINKTIIMRNYNQKISELFDYNWLEEKK